MTWRAKFNISRLSILASFLTVLTLCGGMPPPSQVDFEGEDGLIEEAENKEFTARIGDNRFFVADPSNGYMENEGWGSALPDCFANCQVRYENANSCKNGGDFVLWPFANYFTLAQTKGKGIGYCEDYTTLGLFFAPFFWACNRFQTFLDLEGYVFNKGKWGGSFGIGSRYLLPCQNAALGLNVYYDTRRIHHFDLKQVGVGVEILTPWWDFRVNGYIPLGETEHSEWRLYDYSGDFFAVREKKVSAWGGVDAEAGSWIKKQGLCDCFGLYFAAGPYCYFREHKRHLEHGRRNEAYGGRARLFARFFDVVDLSVIATYDNVWHTRVQGQIALTIPLGSFNRSSCCSCPKTPCLLEQMATQPVNRNGIIAADETCCWVWDWSSASSTSYCYSDMSSGSPPASCSTSEPSIKCPSHGCGFMPNLSHLITPCSSERQ